MFFLGFMGRFDVSTLSFVVYSCDFDITKSTLKWIRPLLWAVFALAPNVIVIACTALILKEVVNITRRSHVRTTLKWQGITTTVLVAIVYCTSILPNGIYQLLESSISNHQESAFHQEFRRFTKSMLCLNTISNFYIYCLTVSSFREFLFRKQNVPQQNSTISTSRTGNKSLIF